MKEMPLLDSFFTESMRLYPSNLELRRIAGEDVEILGKFVPKGTLLCLNNYSLIWIKRVQEREAIHS